MKPEQQQLVYEHRDLVKIVVHQVRRQFDISREMDEMMSAGYEGLVEASIRFEPARGVRFNTFAYYRIRGAVLDAIRAMGRLPRRAYEKQMLLERATDEATEAAAEEWQSMPSEQRTVEGAVQTLDQALGRITTAFVVSQSIADNDTADDKPTLEEAFISRESAGRIRAIVEALPERESKLIRGFYFEGRQFEEVASELGISKSWASRLHTKALERIKKAFESETMPSEEPA